MYADGREGDDSWLGIGLIAAGIVVWVAARMGYTSNCLLLVPRPREGFPEVMLGR